MWSAKQASGQTINTTVLLIEPAVNIYNPVLEGHAHDSVTISVGTCKEGTWEDMKLLQPQ